MTDHVSSRSSELGPSPTNYNYPFASAPDIIRAHQKDAYFEGVLLNHLSSLLRRIYGARFIHTYTSEAKTISDLLYLSLTTLIGNRTLGEEYCDVVQIEDDTLRLPDIGRRAGYILTSVLLPFGLNKILPAFRARIRAKLEKNLQRLEKTKKGKSRSYKLQNYLLNHLSTLTSPSPIHALTITVFYFSGAYYQLSKRIWGLRYIFTRKIPPSEARLGYEVLGVLLVLQIAVQSYLHLRSTLSAEGPTMANITDIQGGTAVLEGGVELQLEPSVYTASDDLLLEGPSTTIVPSKREVEHTTHTEVIPNGHRYHLTDDDEMKWIKGASARKCTLCLEELKDPSATPCGHVFCWSCIGDWVREKPECPLCRREALVQHILPLRS